MAISWSGSSADRSSDGFKSPGGCRAWGRSGRFVEYSSAGYLRVRLRDARMEGAEVPIEIIEPLVMTDGGTPIKTPARNSIPRTRKLSTAAAELEKPAQAPAPPDDARHRPSTANAPVTCAESNGRASCKRATRYSAPTNQLSKTRRCRDGRGENCAGVDPICPYAWRAQRA